jgi:hypothetical protein
MARSIISKILVKAPRVVHPEPRAIGPAKGNREGIQVRFGDKVYEGKKSDETNYRAIFQRAQAELGITGNWKAARVRTEEAG